MSRLKLTNERSLELRETINSYALILCHNNHFFVILSELEASNHMTNFNFVLKADNISAVDHNIIPTFSNDSE